MSLPTQPGKPVPNPLELAILRRLARKEPSITEPLDQLHVLSREFTGVGSFTWFLCDEADAGTSERRVGLDDLIEMPGVSSGMGALLLLKGEEPACLELYTFGDEHWDGVYAGFSLG